MILIDSSTGSRDLVKYPPLDKRSFACLTSLSVSSDTKSSADVCFSGNGPDGKLSIGIEFKSLSDLLSSLYNGRIQTTQVGALVSEYQVCYLLTYGEYRCSPEGYLETPDPGSYTKFDKLSDKVKAFFWYVRGIPYQGPFDSREQAIADYRTNSRRWTPYTFIGGKPMVFGYLESALLSLSRAGIQHKHFTRIEDCAQWIGCCYRSWSKPWDEHKLFRTFDKSPNVRLPEIPGLKKEDRENFKFKMSIAKELPGIGYERALEAARHFDTVRDMLNADVGDWLGVQGIGKTLAKAIVAAASAGKQKSNAKPVDQTDGPNLSLFD